MKDKGDMEIKAGVETISEIAFDDIWRIEKRLDFIIALGAWICNKCDYWNDMGLFRSEP